MSLVSLDDSFFDHPKAVAAGEDGANLHVRALAYCRRYNTKGKVLKGALSKLTTKRDASKHAAACVVATLWHDEGDHWLIHDYDQWYGNDAEAKLAKQRKLAASRQRKFRETQSDVTQPPESRDSNVTGDVRSDVEKTSPRARARAGASPYSYTDSLGENPPPLSENTRPTPIVDWERVENPDSPTGDELAWAMWSRCKDLPQHCSLAQLVELGRLAREAKPRALTVADFDRLGDGFEAKRVLTWMDHPPSIGTLIANGGKHLFDALGQAPVVASPKSAPAIRIIREPTADDRAAALALLRDRKVTHG